MKFIYIFFGAGIILMTACNQPDKKLTDTSVTPDSTISPAKKDTAVAHGEFNVDTVHSAKENKILDKLSSLPEVRKSTAYIDSFTNHQHGIAFMIFKPEKGEKDYYVQAGYSGPDRFETYYNFYVDSATFSIKIDDVIEGDIIPIAEWRKREAKRK